MFLNPLLGFEFPSSKAKLLLRDLVTGILVGVVLVRFVSLHHFFCFSFSKVNSTKDWYEGIIIPKPNNISSYSSNWFTNGNLHNAAINYCVFVNSIRGPRPWLAKDWHKTTTRVVKRVIRIGGVLILEKWRWIFWYWSWKSGQRDFCNGNYSILIILCVEVRGSEECWEERCFRDIVVE